MGRAGARLPSFCLNRTRPLVRVRSPSSIKSKPEAANSISLKTDPDQKKTQESPSTSSTIGKENAKAGLINIGRRIMIVVDSSVEAKGALQWALSPSTVQSHDTLILLYVTKPSKQGPTCFSLSLFFS